MKPTLDDASPTAPEGGGQTLGAGATCAVSVQLNNPLLRPARRPQAVRETLHQPATMPM